MVRHGHDGATGRARFEARSARPRLGGILREEHTFAVGTGDPEACPHTAVGARESIDGQGRVPLNTNPVEEATPATTSRRKRQEDECARPRRRPRRAFRWLNVILTKTVLGKQGGWPNSERTGASGPKTRQAVRRGQEAWAEGALKMGRDELAAPSATSRPAAPERTDVPTAPGELPAEMLLRYTGVPEGRAAPGCWASPGTTCHRWWSSRAWRSRLPAARLRQDWGLDRGAPARPSRLRRERGMPPSCRGIRWPSTGTCGRGGGDRSGVAARQEVRQQSAYIRYIRRSRPVGCTITTASVHLWTFLSGALGRREPPDTSKVPGMTTSTLALNHGTESVASPAPLCWQRLADRARRRGRLVALSTTAFPALQHLRPVYRGAAEAATDLAVMVPASRRRGARRPRHRPPDHADPVAPCAVAGPISHQGSGVETSWRSRPLGSSTYAETAHLIVWYPFQTVLMPGRSR